MSVLDEICARKALHVEEQKKAVTLEALQDCISVVEQPRGFIHALKNHEAPVIITEIKKASPSRGVIREDFDIAEIARIYEEHDACCLSVLTDEPYFQGKDEYLGQAKGASTLPVLRKDFMIDPYQIYESRALGADCILLIMACLSDEQAPEFHELARSLNMDVLVEVHDEEELFRALKLSPGIIGVNNRNLKSMEVDIQTSHDLANKIPDDILKISESGISSSAVIKTLIDVGYQGFLIGESLMREENIGAALQNLIDTERELN